MRKPMKKQVRDQQKTYINDDIRASEVRVVGPDGEQLGILSIREALSRAREYELDLIEVSAKAVPPVAKIMDYGKFTYEQKKKQREIKANSFTTETKSVQVKIGTGAHDRELKATRAANWLIEGHRVKVDLFLWGRYKYMEETFLKDRLKGFLDIIKVPFKLADPIKRSPKGFTCTIERDKSKPVPEKMVLIDSKKAQEEEHEPTVDA